MIVREIKDDPEPVIANFDYFNDYKDTRSWLVGMGEWDVLRELDQGYALDEIARIERVRKMFDAKKVELKVEQKGNVT